MKCDIGRKSMASLTFNDNKFLAFSCECLGTKSFRMFQLIFGRDLIQQ